MALFLFPTCVQLFFQLMDVNLVLSIACEHSSKRVRIKGRIGGFQPKKGTPLPFRLRPY
jgi:hypothetical protein